MACLVWHHWSPTLHRSAECGHPSERLRLTGGITQRWDLMALRLSASQRPTSDPQPWPRLTPPILPGPVFVTGHLSKPCALIWLRPNLEVPTTRFSDQDKLLSATLHDNKSLDCCGKSKGTRLGSVLPGEPRQKPSWTPALMFYLIADFFFFL